MYFVNNFKTTQKYKNKKWKGKERLKTEIMFIQKPLDRGRGGLEIFLKMVTLGYVSEWNGAG